MMRVILEYNDYLEQAAASIDISDGANISAPVVESDEEEDRPIVVFRPPQKKAMTSAKNTPPKKITKKTTKQTEKNWRNPVHFSRYKYSCNNRNRKSFDWKWWVTFVD